MKLSFGSMASSSTLFVLFLLFSTMASTYSHKPTHLHFYFLDTISGPNTTNAAVTRGPSGDRFGFGVISVIDDRLTEGPDEGSAVIGRAQGIYVLDKLDARSLLMSLTLVFTAGEFNGSTLAVLGQNPVGEEMRELPIVGGTGKFRLGRGYALLKTVSANGVTAIVEYDVYVLHG